MLEKKLTTCTTLMVQGHLLFIFYFEYNVFVPLPYFNRSIRWILQRKAKTIMRGSHTFPACNPESYNRLRNVPYTNYNSGNH